MAEMSKNFDSNLQDGVRVATPEEAGEINASTGFINKESVLNDGQLTDDDKSNLEAFGWDDDCENQNGGDGDNSSSFIHTVFVNGKEHHISQKRLEARAKYYSLCFRTFYSLTAMARKEWRAKGYKLTEDLCETAGEFRILYDYSEMRKIVYKYILWHPEKVIEMEEKYRQRSRARKILGMCKGQKVTDEDIEKATDILKFIKKNKVKKYLVDDYYLYVQNSTGSLNPISFEEVRNGKN